MITKNLFLFVKASILLPLAGIEYNTTAKNKMRCLDSSGKPTDFTDAEKQSIELAYWKLTRDADVQIRRDRSKKKPSNTNEKSAARKGGTTKRTAKKGAKK